MSKHREIEAHYEEEEEPQLEEDIEDDEEEEMKDLVVIDEETIDNVIGEIETGNPTLLAQAVEIILGSLGLKENIIIEEDCKVNPLEVVLVPLLEKITQMYNSSKEGSKKKEGLQRFLTDLSQTLESFSKFKSSTNLFSSYCQCVFIMRQYVDKSDVSKALSQLSHFGMLKKEYSSFVYELYDQFILEPEFAPLVYKLQYVEFTTSVGSKHDEAIERLLPIVTSFYMKQKDLSISYVKNLIKGLAKEISETMKNSSKGIFSWMTIGSLEFITRFIIDSNENRLVFSYISILFTFLKNFPIINNLPFQIRVAIMIQNIANHFNVFTPLLSWIAEAFQTICSQQCKGNTKFVWEELLASPQLITFEYCETAIDRLKRLFMVSMKPDSENIAFPEYIQMIRKKLENIIATSKNQKLAQKPKSLIKTLSEQQDFLVNLKKEVNWSNRGEQLRIWREKVSEVETPLKKTMQTESRVIEKINQMKPKGSVLVDETGDTLQVATIDDI